MASPQQDTPRQLMQLIGPVCVDAGYDLVEVEYSQGPQGWLVRVYIDFPQDSQKSIGFQDCENLSHELAALLDVEDPIPHKYHLEVSSPGVDRPLRKPEDFRRYQGKDVKVSLHTGLDGRRNYKGRLESISEDGTTVTVMVDQDKFDLPLADLSSAKLIPDWNSLMKGKGKHE